MDQRKDKNLQTKRAITDAVFRLIPQQQLADLSVTQIVREAGVARVSYYRNFHSKEDVIVTLIDDVLDEFDAEARKKGIKPYTYEYVLLTFKFFYDYKDYANSLMDNRYGHMIFDRINSHHELIDGSMSISSIERYRIYAYTGSLINMVYIWLREGAKESPEEIAAYFFEMIRKI